MNIKCDLCNHRKYKKLYNNYDRVYNLSGKFSLLKCNNCGLIFLYPQPNKKDILKYYPSEKYYSLNNNSIEDSKIKIYNIFYKKGYSIKKILFSPLKFMIRKIIIKKRANFLDIGCGDGKFLKLMNKFEMNCYGVEPNNKGNIIEENLKIVNCELKEAKFKKEFFDIITLNHVFEHVNQPSSILQEIHRILKPKGKLIIATPNSNSLITKIFKNKWFQFDTPRHFFLYSEKTIKKYAEKKGFKVNKIVYNSTPLQISASMIYLLNQFRKKKIFLSETKIHTSKIIFVFLLFPIYLLNFFCLGDQFEIILSKK
jgi:ubiquinone/menaquinone biosynthesis C-methylase UbiE